MFIWWGDELIQFHNDGYRQTLGPERRPTALGQPGRPCWEEAWDLIGPDIERVMREGASAWYEVLKHFPARDSRPALYGEIDWDDLIDNPHYINTCAVRMSYGLLRAGVPLPGARMKAKSGALAGKYIEPGHEKLSNILKVIWESLKSAPTNRRRAPALATAMASYRSFASVAARLGTSV